MTNERNQTVPKRNENPLGFNSVSASNSSEKQNQDNSKDEDDDTVSMPQRRTRQR